MVGYDASFFAFLGVNISGQFPVPRGAFYGCDAFDTGTMIFTLMKYLRVAFLVAVLFILLRIVYCSDLLF